MTVKKIKTNKGLYIYSEQDLEIGRPYLDKKICCENLLLFKKIMDKNKIPFGIIFGTLLGAIREGDFISHDEDVDVFVYYNSFYLIKDILIDFRGFGFELIRYSSDLLSLKRKNNFIDIYIFKINLNYEIWKCMGYELNNKYLEDLDKIKFLGYEFRIPAHAEELLIFFYGSDWQIPKIGYHAQPQNYKILRQYLFPFIPKKIKKIIKKLSSFFDLM